MPRGVLGVKHCQAIAQPPVTVCCATALHCLKVGICLLCHLSILEYGHAFCFGHNVFKHGIFIIDTLAELRTLFLVENVQYRLIGQHTAKSYIGCLKFLLQAFPHQLPQHTVVTSISVDGLVCGGQLHVDGILVYIISIFQSAVISNTHDGIIIVEDEIPQNFFPPGMIEER